ncbi:hypothetical protein CORMATOL_01268 [Corynebacterium matruchotii ATCC 33806]|uniref:Uncharacterized protein n=1 Tax=Corynebacterium matruchotii ATCC 33806 TaxID=566549 RepID=C0E2R3_9CORY|nr:hypothetical protein CORMATOL_01268 [Corynebacterium matruchotii ATCC 33806]
MRPVGFDLPLWVFAQFRADLRVFRSGFDGEVHGLHVLKYRHILVIFC